VTTQALRDILAQAGQAKKPVRVVGSGHSWSYGAVPGGQPYSPGAAIDAFLIDLTNLNPTNCAADPSLKAVYFKDAAGNPYVAVPPGTAQGWLADNAANVNDPNHQYSNAHDPAALLSMGPAPDITLGGFVANGCHGTGWEQPTVSDLVVAVELLTLDASGNVVARAFAATAELAALLALQQITTVAPEVAPANLLAAQVSLGALGVLTKIVFALVPLFNVAALDEVVGVDQLFPANGDTTNLETLVTSTDYVEIFWFPYNSELWVKRFSRTNQGTQHPEKVVGFDWIVSELAELTQGRLGEMFASFPWLTPLTLQIFFGSLKLFMGSRELKSFTFAQDFDPSSDAVVPVPDAYLYQTKYFTNILDLEHTIPIAAKPGGGYDFNAVATAFRTAAGTIAAMQQSGTYPISLNLHFRFVKNSAGLLSPAWQTDATTHTCYIEFLSFSEQLTQYAAFAQKVVPQWQAAGGLPHWAKMLQVVPGILAHGHQQLQSRGTLAPFLALRTELDPRGTFLNNFLNQLLLGQPASAAAAATVRPAPTTGKQSKERFATPRAPAAYPPQSPAVSERGCRLVQDDRGGIALLVDEHGEGHPMKAFYDAAAGQVEYCLVSVSRFLSPRDVFLRVGEVLLENATRT
jgi:FAD/FMN-containing dehydrogenase